MLLIYGALWHKWLSNSNSIWPVNTFHLLPKKTFLLEQVEE